MNLKFVSDACMLARARVDLARALKPEAWPFFIYFMNNEDLVRRKLDSEASLRISFLVGLLKWCTMI
jgi:hypothetical protein